VSDQKSILKIEGLDAGYGISQVLFDVSLNFNEIGATAILGMNGAGKTTLLKTIVGEIRPNNGVIHFDGENSTTENTDKKIRRGMAYVPQENAVFNKLTVKENIILGANASNEKADIDMVLDFFPKLGERLGQQAGTLSGGERKMLAISRALVGKPKLIMLDEPTEGVWIGVIEEIAERLEILAKEISVILVEQHLELAIRVCSYTYVLDRGKVALKGPSENVRENTELLRLLTP
jgi:branched-chain amino acid transport system ATP-binding protein